MFAKPPGSRQRPSCECSMSKSAPSCRSSKALALGVTLRWPRFFAPLVDFFFFFDFALARLFSASLLMTCSTPIGVDVPCSTSSSDKANRARPRTGLPKMDKKKRSRPFVFFPALVTTLLSPARMYSCSGVCRWLLKNSQDRGDHGKAVWKKR